MCDRGSVWCAQPKIEPPGLDFGGTAALCEVEDRPEEEEEVQEVMVGGNEAVATAARGCRRRGWWSVVTL